MEAVEHSLKLKDGRTLAYQTFPKAEENPEGLHPVIYFHGYPGCGREAGFVCANSVARAGGKVFAIDRPGMGKTSSPYDKSTASSEEGDRAPTNLKTFMDNVWELIEDQGWKEFSVVGASGGGPFTLALLASYLQRRESSSKISDSNPVARIRSVCLVSALCISAGTDGMKDELTSLATTVKEAPTSRWYSVKLGMMSATAGLMYSYLIPALPSSWTTSMIASQYSDAPPADREWISDESKLIAFLSATQSMAAQGGYPGLYDDGLILLRPEHAHEEVLRKLYADENGDLPAVGIFQGALDVNVPAGHAKFMHESIFHKRSKFFDYKDLGHLSTVEGKSEEYAAFAIEPSKK